MSRKKRVSFSNWARKVQQSEWLWAEQETLSITASESLKAEENITSREIFACCIGTKTFYTFIFNGLHSIPPFGCTGRVWIINASTQHKVFAYISAQKNSFQCVCVFFWLGLTQMHNWFNPIMVRRNRKTVLVSQLALKRKCCLSFACSFQPCTPPTERNCGENIAMMTTTMNNIQWNLVV